jgi:hypothetical protein
MVETSKNVYDMEYRKPHRHYTNTAEHSHTRLTAPNHIVVVAYAANALELALLVDADRASRGSLAVAYARAHLAAEQIRYRVNEKY